MSRSGYDEDCYGWELIRYRGAVASAIRGARGQSFLREMLAALDAMPEKILIEHELEDNGRFCAMGVVGNARGLPMAGIDAYDPEQIASAFGIAESLAREVAWINDDEFSYAKESLQDRWTRVRKWVVENLKP